MSDTRSENERPLLRVYRADNRFSDSVFAALSHLVREIWNHRAQVSLIFRRDFRAAYRGTALGIVWNFVLPLLPVSVYVLLSVLNVFPAVDHLPRGVYVSFNVTLWLFFAGLIEQPISVVKARNSDAMKTSLPISVAIASSFATLSFETLLRVLLVAVLVLAALLPISPFAPLALLVILLGAAFSLSVGLLLAISNIVVPDTQSITTIIMRYGIFVSGVIFPLSAIGPLQWLEVFNPFAVLIQAARELTFHGTLSQPIALLVIGCVTVGVGLFSCRTFYLMEYRIRGVV